MPNRKQHVIAGALTGVVWAALDERVKQSQDRLAYLSGAAMSGAVAGRMPDILEPACSPCHRQFAHGLIPCIVTVWNVKDLAKQTLEKLLQQADAEQDSNQRWCRFFIAGLLKGFGPGYL